MNRMRGMQVAVVVVLAIGALSGCSADWSGDKRLATDECQAAAQLFPQTAAAPAPSATGAPAISNADLSESLRPHVPEEFAEILDAFAQTTTIAETASAEEVAAGTVQRDRQQRATAVLQEWAMLACGSGIAGDPSMAASDEADLPRLAEMQVLRSESDGTPQLAVTGALDPMHAVALCKAARVESGAETRITVLDPDGFPLALAEAGADCDYDPALLQAFTDNSTDSTSD